ncbi:MAG: endonuclease/exonuclease/phosphatase family protein [Pseudomonadota bacterium]
MNGFTDAEWDRVFGLQWTQFGAPARRSKSVVLSSFNIRKLGKRENKSERAWTFLASYLQRCDLIAIQEVQDDLEALSHLHDLMGRRSYGFIASDTTGRDAQPHSGMSERLAFFYRRRRIDRTAIASDISYDRAPVTRNILEHHDGFARAFKAKHDADNRSESEQNALEQAWKDGGKVGPRPLRKKDPFVLPHFLTFIRTPHAATFRIGGRDDAKPYEFMAVNAHLLYGHKDKQKEERELEFMALLEWLIWRAKKRDVTYAKDLILLGDLNFDLEEVDERREWVANLIRSLNKNVLGSAKDPRVYFPFIDAHPKDGDGEVFRTNARKTQTYDQIAVLSHDKRLPAPGGRHLAGQDADGFNYGMFDFVELFARAVHGQRFSKLSEAKKKALYKKFEHDVSDHMPIWIRLPVPAMGMGTFDA